jgi:hypothetical protein
MRISWTSSGDGSSLAAFRSSKMIWASVGAVRSAPLFASTTCTSAPPRMRSAISWSRTYRLSSVS